MPVTSNLLHIQNPHRIYGPIVLGTGGVLALLVVARWPVFVPTLYALITRAADEPSRFVDALTVESALGMGILLVSAWFCLFASIRAIRYIVWGLKRTLSFFVPTGVPKSLPRQSPAVSRLLDDRIIESYEKPPAAIMLASRIFSERLRYATHGVRLLAEDLIHSIAPWLISLGVLTAPAFIPATATTHLPQGFHWVEPWLGPGWPVPVYLYLIGAFAAGARVLAILSSMPAAPGIRIAESRQHMDTTGNPENFYNHVQNTLTRFRYGDFPNRYIDDMPPRLGTLNPGETSRFHTRLLVETQPLPIAGGFPVNAALLGLAGGVLISAGYALLLFLQPVPLATQRLPIVHLGLQVVSGLVAVSTGKSLMNRAYVLRNVFRFRSHLFDIDVDGTYTVSRIGIGDGRGGQLYSERASVQSDSYLHVRGTELVTECLGLEEERIILDSRSSSQFEEALRHLNEDMCSFDDTGRRLAGVDLVNQNVRDIVAGNAEISTVMEQARLSQGETLPAARSLPPHATPVLGPADGEWKACPECGEKVRVAARKCRFCQYRFEELVGG